MPRRHAFIMVIHGNRHDLFRVFLAHDIFVQPFLDHMRRRYLFQVKSRLLFFLLFLPFQLLPLRLEEVHVGKVDHADVRHAPVLHEVIHIESAPLHRIERLLHTVAADEHILLQADHFFHLALCAFADKAKVFVLIVLLLRFFSFRMEFFQIVTHSPSSLG